MGKEERMVKKGGRGREKREGRKEGWEKGKWDQGKVAKGGERVRSGRMWKRNVKNGREEKNIIWRGMEGRSEEERE